MSYTQIMSDKISKMLDESLTLCDNGDPSKAVTKLTRAIALQPQNSDLFEQRAEAYVLLKNYDLAIVNFQKVIALRNGDAIIFERLGVVHWKYGEALYKEEMYSRALEIYERAAEYRPNDKNIVMRRISCLLALERYTECVAMIKDELETDDTNPELYVLRAKLKLLFGDTTAAYYDVCSALELKPSHKVASEMKADLEESALQCKNQAIHNSLVGRKLDALKKITTAIETDPAVADYHIFRGALYRRMKDFNAAMDDFLVAMDKVSHQQDCEVYKNASRQLVLTYNDFAMECFRQRHFGEAVVLLNKAIKEEKKEKGLYLNRGDCFYRLNNLRFALADYQQALELDPLDWDISCRVGIVCSELGVESYSKEKYSEAEAHFTAAIRHNPKVSRFYVCRARTRHVREDIAGTKDDLLAALTLDPDNEECISLIARAFPGKTKMDLIDSHEATIRKRLLEYEIQQLSARTLHHPDLTANYITRRTPSQHLTGIELKFEDSSEFLGSSTTLGQDHNSVAIFVTPVTEASCSSTAEEHQDKVGFKTEGDNCDLERVSDDGEAKDETVNPRQWSVLSHPLPELTVDPQGILPDLKECLQEQSFHKKIYYSKKNCTDEVHHALKSPPNICRPIKLEAAIDKTLKN